MSGSVGGGEITFEAVGTGLTVFEDDPVEGPAVWLDSPQAVMDFVATGPVADSIAIVRGGTTTFLTPVLMAGVKGIVTLQWAPESHLGILAREYGVPCLMSVAFEKGMRSDRGEIVPADGALVRLDVTTSPRGTVLVDAGAPTSDAESRPSTPEMDPETLAQIQVLLARYRGETPHGDEGNRMLQARLVTRTLHLDDETLRRDLSRDEANEMLDYVGWAMWDCLAARATEGESGLIPRQEYEAIGFLQSWQRHPQAVRFITDEIGIDGVIELGAVARREIGTKINILRNLAVGFMAGFGRGVAVALGAQGPADREEDLRDVLQFMRRLYKGTWGDGGTIFTCSRGYAAPLLGPEWIERFRADAEPLADPEARRAFQRFSASTELMGFLLHFDCRGGTSDTGPYPMGDGSFLIVRDHFLNEDLYHWSDAAAGLPHAVTQAMIFKPDAELSVSLIDTGTIFTQPANYLKYITGAAVYVRERWDTPVTDVRLLDAAGRARILAGCEEATARLYARIASMTRRDKVMAGMQVYYADFLVPYARRAGLWDRMRTELDFFEVDPVTSEAYYPLVRDGQAATLVPQLFITGSGFPPIPPIPPVDDPELLGALHRLALRGAAALPGDAGPLVAARLVVDTPAGLMLTEAGQLTHDRLLTAERMTFDASALAAPYERFLAVNTGFKALAGRWQAAGEDDRWKLLGDLERLVARVGPELEQVAAVLPRFGHYQPRLAEAMERAGKGELDYVLSPRVESVHTVWMECHEDLLQTLAISREAEGSF